MTCLVGCLAVLGALITVAHAFDQSIHSASALAPLDLDAIAPISGVTGDAANSVAQQLGASALGASILKLVPRFGFPSSLAAAISGSSSDQTGYGIGVAIQFAYGLILAVLTLLVGCCFCWCRCCCNWCGAREPLPGGYTKYQRWGTWLVMLVFTLTVVALCIFGWYNNNQLTQSAVGSSAGLFDIVKNLLGNTIFFLDGTVAQVGTAIPASQPPITVLLGTVKTQIPTAVTNIQGLLAQTGFLFTSVPSLQSQIGATGQGMSNLQININGTMFNCSFCQTVGGQVTTMKNDLATKSDKYLKDFKQTLANTNTTLVNQAASITDKVGSFQNTASSIATDVVAPLYRRVGGQYKSTAAGYDAYRNTAVFIVFALPCLALLAALAGAALVSPVPFTAYYWVGYIASFFVFLLFAVHLPLAVVVQDTCAYMASVDADFGKVDALGDGGTFLNASIYNRSLIDAFNLSAQLDFVNQINFDVPDVRANFTFAPITNFTSAVLALSLQTFGFDSQLLTNALVALNATSSLCSPPGAYTRANVQGCASAACPTTSNSPAFWANCSYAIKASLQETGLSGVLAQMKLNATAINASTAALQASVDGLYVVTFPQLKSTLTPLFDSVRTARNSAHSGFVGVSYIQFKTTMCSSFLGSFTMLALCSLAIGVLNFVVIVTATVLAKRMPFPKQADEPELVAELAELSVDSSVGASASARPSSEFSPTALASAVTAVNHRQAPPSSSSAVASSIGGAQFNHGLARQSIIAASPPPLSLARKPVRGGALEM